MFINNQTIASHNILGDYDLKPEYLNAAWLDVLFDIELWLL